MTFTLLMDLDDTLLDTNIDSFIPFYFKKLSTFMASKIQPDLFIQSLIESTQVMYSNTLMDKTLEKAFSDDFYPRLGIDEAELKDSLEQFYDNIFPTLGSVTKIRPEAIEFVEWAFSQGWEIAIATDPLFPRKAILHRLRWAGLAPEKYPFKLISDFQHFHFVKANGVFYPEFLFQMGWNEEPVLMVGDSLKREIEPCVKNGVPVFLLTQDYSSDTDHLPSGWFGNLKDFLKNIDINSLKVNNSTPEAIISFLKATPAVINTQMLLHDSEHITRNFDHKDMSYKDTLTKLRDLERDVNLTALEKITGEKYRNSATGELIPHQGIINKDSNEILDTYNEFLSLRKIMVDKLSVLSLHEWNGSGKITNSDKSTLMDLMKNTIEQDRVQIFRGRQILESQI